MNELIRLLIKKNKTVSSMESCTGGCLANEITNIEGASDVFKFGAVTYSNEFKIKMGVDMEVIDKYSVYSIETARCMSKSIADFTNSSYGIGITGKINRVDKNNLYGNDNLVYVCIYDCELDRYYDINVEMIYKSRIENKKLIIDNVIELLSSVI